MLSHLTEGQPVLSMSKGGKLFNHLDTGLRRYDAIFLMDYPG